MAGMEEVGSRKGAVASMKVDAAGRRGRGSLCIYGGGGGGHEWAGWGLGFGEGFWMGVIPVVRCVVGKREGRRPR
jgi:hypothetical protein